MAGDAVERARRGAVRRMVDARLRYELYERAAQSPGRQARFVQALAGERARALGEDFCGTGALSAAWAQLSGEHRAVAVDWDGEPLGILREKLRAEAVGDRVEVVQSDVNEVDAAADVIAVLNFSMGYFHERAGLIAYLKRARGRLNEGGVFVCDIYGGVDQFAVGESELELRGGVRYVWEQREVDPLTARVVNAMHFELENGERVRDAFVYDWRLWSAVELRDGLRECGFGTVEFYDRLGDGELDDGALLVTPARGDELDENFVVYVVGRA